MSKQKTICLVLADLTALAVDAMVNPANESLLPGSGLCGLMHKKAGTEMTTACQELFRQQRQRPTGSVSVTTAGALPARYVIHAIGPKWHEHPADPATPLRETYRNILRCADQLQIETLSIPAISTGMHKYPKDFAAQVTLETLAQELEQCVFIRNVILVSSSVENAQAYRENIRLGLGVVSMTSLLPMSI